MVNTIKMIGILLNVVHFQVHSINYGMKYQKFVYGRYNLTLFFILHENNLSTNVFLKCILAVEIRLFVVALLHSL